MKLTMAAGGGNGIVIGPLVIAQQVVQRLAEKLGTAQTVVTYDPHGLG